MAKHKHYRAVFFGTPDFGVPVLHTLIAMSQIDVVAVVTQPDKPVGKKQTLSPPPIKIAAQQRQLPVLQPEKIKTKVFSSLLQQYKPDVCIVIAYGKIIPASLLQIPRHGWVNVHASLLPKHRGASPIQSTILSGDAVTGVTLMQIDSGLDTGPIIAQLEMPIAARETCATLHDALANQGAEIIKQYLLPYLNGDIKPSPQDNTRATLTRIISKTDGRIDWSCSAAYIDRHIRAYTPWPGAFTYWGAKRIRIIEVLPHTITSGLAPGQIKYTRDKLLVGCGTGACHITKLQLAGKKLLLPDEFIRGYPQFTSARLR